MRVSFRRTAVLAGAILCGAWVGFLALGKPVAEAAASRFHGTISKVIDGKSDDQFAFVHGRMTEAMELFTLTIMCALAAAVFWKWLGNNSQLRPARGLVMGAVIFLLLNVMALAAGSTVLFWALFYDKVNVDNFAQYHIKRALMKETSDRPRAILLGSSQTNRAIDEVLMNQWIGKRLWTTELAQPGARGFDMLTLSRDIPLKEGDLVICYLSEIMFYGKGSGIVAAEFMNFSEIPDAVGWNGWNFLVPKAVQNGLIGRVFPLYRYQKSISHRVLGWDITHVTQKKFDQSLEADLEEQARRRAPQLDIGETSAFEQAAFTRMVEELSAKGCKILVIEGHTHPAIRKYLDPAVVPHLRHYLEDLAASHTDSMILRDGASFFTPDAADFADLVHFTDQAQQRFTLELVNYLDQPSPPQ